MAEPIIVQEDPKANLLSNILTIIGFIILIIIVVWGIVHLASLSRGWFSSLFPQHEPTIQVTAPTDATSGTPFTISWNYTPSTKGSYAFLYQCQSGLQLEMAGANGAMSGIPCGAAFSVPATGNSVSVTPTFSGNASTNVPLSIVFIPSTGSGNVQGSASVTVHPAAVAVAPVQTAPAKTATTYTAKPATYAGAADLSVRIISANIDQNGNAVVTFDIGNVGGSTSGVYYFTAQPTSGGAPYNSVAQTPLAPGSHMINTLRFTNAVSGNFSVAVGASDRNQSNNYASQWLSAPVSYYPNTYSNPNTYQNYGYQSYPATYPTQYSVQPSYSYPTYQY